MSKANRAMTNINGDIERYVYVNIRGAIKKKATENDIIRIFSLVTHRMWDEGIIDPKQVIINATEEYINR